MTWVQSSLNHGHAVTPAHDREPRGGRAPMGPWAPWARWGPMGPHGAPWGPMGPHGAPWGSHGGALRLPLFPLRGFRFCSVPSHWTPKNATLPPQGIRELVHR